MTRPTKKHTWFPNRSGPIKEREKDPFRVVSDGWRALFPSFCPPRNTGNATVADWNIIHLQRTQTRLRSPRFLSHSVPRFLRARSTPTHNRHHLGGYSRVTDILKKSIRYVCRLGAALPPFFIFPSLARLPGVLSLPMVFPNSRALIGCLELAICGLLTVATGRARPPPHAACCPLVFV